MYYTIRSGDTFWKLEQRNGWPSGTLQQLNPGIQPEALFVGQVINTPGGSNSNGGHRSPAPRPISASSDAAERFRHTFYWIADESQFNSGAQTEVRYWARDERVRVVNVDRRFYQEMCTEATGRTRSGLVLNDIGVDHGQGRTRVTVDGDEGERYWGEISGEWGLGSNGNELVPWRSVATDPKHHAFGSRLLLPAFQGKRISVAGFDFTHDGWFYVMDVGTSINGRNRINIFIGRPACLPFAEDLAPGNYVQGTWYA